MEAEAAQPGSGRLIFLPLFQRQQRRAILGQSGFGRFFRPGHGARKAGDGPGRCSKASPGEIAVNLRVIESLIGTVVKIGVAGGLSRSDFFNQLLADICQRRLEIGGNREATAYGAWSQAMLALGKAASHADAFTRSAECPNRLLAPDSSLADLYEAVLARRGKLYASLAAMRQK